MKYAILRIQKLKSAASVRRSLQHAFRDKDTPNADPNRRSENSHFGAHSTREALDKFNERLPDKVRKNGVMAVEYLFTASPEIMAEKNRAQQDAYFVDALKWLEDKHGKENVVYAGIHRDETTPHMYAYVVPLDDRGRLNARHFFGEQNALGKMQTDFAERVGQKHALERGIEGSKAKHVKIQQYYAQVNAPLPKVPNVVYPEPSWKAYADPSAYGKQVAQSVMNQISPTYTAFATKATQVDATNSRVASLEAARKASEAAHAEKVRNLEAKLKTLSEFASVVVEAVKAGGSELDNMKTMLQARDEANSTATKNGTHGKQNQELDI
jgi:Plasmid recombination enzyme